VTSEGETEENEGFFADLINSFRTLPARSLQLWVVQFSWWAAVLNMGVWWTSWVGIEVYGGDPDSKDPHLTSLFDHGVWVGTLGILLQVGVASSVSSNCTHWSQVFLCYDVSTRRVLWVCCSRTCCPISTCGGAWLQSITSAA